MQDPQCKGVIKGVAIGQDGQPATGIELVVWPTDGRDFAYIFPTTKTNPAGEYRFDVHLCPGRYAVSPEDDKAGYPIWSIYLYRVLYGGSEPPEVNLTAERPEVELRVILPPKPGLLKSAYSIEIPSLRLRTGGSGGGPWGNPNSHGSRCTVIRRSLCRFLQTRTLSCTSSPMDSRSGREARKKASSSTWLLEAR